MLDIALIREKPEWVKAQIARLNDNAPIDEIVALDGRRREIIQEVEALRQERNEASKQIGRWMDGLKKIEGELKRAEAGQDGGRPAAEVRAEYEAGAYPVDLIATLGLPDAGSVAIDLAVIDARPADAGSTDALLALEARDGTALSLAAALASIPAYWLVGRRYRRR